MFARVTALYHVCPILMLWLGLGSTMVFSTWVWLVWGDKLLAASVWTLLPVSAYTIHDAILLFANSSTCPHQVDLMMLEDILKFGLS